MILPISVPSFHLFWGIFDKRNHLLNMLKHFQPGSAHEVAQIMISHEEMDRFAELPVEGVAVETLP